MSSQVTEWVDFFARVFSEVKKTIFDQYILEEDGSGPPEILALREAVAKFPCPIRIAEIKIDTEKHRQIRDELCQIVSMSFQN